MNVVAKEARVDFHRSTFHDHVVIGRAQPGSHVAHAVVVQRLRLSPRGIGETLEQQCLVTQVDIVDVRVWRVGGRRGPTR